MTTQTFSSPNPRQRLQHLGCQDPKAIALLPANLYAVDSFSDLRQAPEAATVAKLLEAAGLPLSELWTTDNRPPYVQNNAFEWVAPTLFFSAALLSQNPACLSIAIGVIANYVTDFFRGITGEKKATLEIITEAKDGKCKRLRYEGPPDQLSNLPEIARSLSDD